MEAAKESFSASLQISQRNHPIPRVINIDKNAAYPAALKQLQQDGTLLRRVRLRPCKFLHKCGGTRSSSLQKSSLVGPRLQNVPECAAHSRKHGSNTQDSEGAGETSSQERCSSRSKVHSETLWLGGLTTH